MIPAYLSLFDSGMWHEMDLTSVAVKLAIAFIVLFLLGRVLEPSTSKELGG